MTLQKLTLKKKFGANFDDLFLFCFECLQKHIGVHFFFVLESSSLIYLPPGCGMYIYLLIISNYIITYFEFGHAQSLYQTQFIPVLNNVTWLTMLAQLQICCRISFNNTHTTKKCLMTCQVQATARVAATIKLRCFAASGLFSFDTAFVIFRCVWFEN